MLGILLFLEALRNEHKHVCMLGRRKVITYNLENTLQNVVLGRHCGLMVSVLDTEATVRVRALIGDIVLCS